MPALIFIKIWWFEAIPSLLWGSGITQWHFFTYVWVTNMFSSSRLVGKRVNCFFHKGKIHPSQRSTGTPDRFMLVKKQVKPVDVYSIDLNPTTNLIQSWFLRVQSWCIYIHIYIYMYVYRSISGKPQECWWNHRFPSAEGQKKIWRRWLLGPKRSLYFVIEALEDAGRRCWERP